MCISSKIRKFIDQQINNNSDKPFNGTIIVIGNKIMCYATSCNLGRPSNYVSRRAKTDKIVVSIHAEIKALQLIRRSVLKKRKYKSVVVINFRSTNTGIKNSCCCIPCMQTLNSLGINKVIYSNENGDFVKSNIEKISNIAIYSRGSRQYMQNL